MLRSLRTLQCLPSRPGVIVILANSRLDADLKAALLSGVHTRDESAIFDK